MTVRNREPALQALQTLIQNAYAWAQPVARKLKMFNDSMTRPAAFIFEGGDESRLAPAGASQGPRARVLPANLVVYIDAPDDQIGATRLNAIMDAVDAALEPAGADMMLGRNTLRSGGVETCHAVYIAPGESVLKVPGDIDDVGMLWVKLQIILP